MTVLGWPAAVGQAGQAGGRAGCAPISRMRTIHSDVNDHGRELSLSLSLSHSLSLSLSLFILFQQFFEENKFANLNDLKGLVDKLAEQC